LICLNSQYGADRTCGGVWMSRGCDNALRKSLLLRSSPDAPAPKGVTPNKLMSPAATCTLHAYKTLLGKHGNKEWQRQQKVASSR